MLKETYHLTVDRITSIVLCKIRVTFRIRNGMRMNRYCPWRDVNGILTRPDSSISVCQYCLFEVNVEKIAASPMGRSHSYIHQIANESRFITTFASYGTMDLEEVSLANRVFNERLLALWRILSTKQCYLRYSRTQINMPSLLGKQGWTGRRWNSSNSQVTFIHNESLLSGQRSVVYLYRW